MNDTCVICSKLFKPLRYIDYILPIKYYKCAICKYNVCIECCDEELNSINPQFICLSCDINYYRDKVARLENRLMIRQSKSVV